MPFLRFTRDKRGYEHFQLIQTVTSRRGTERPRILYWFRSPPNVRVGRKPFDDAVRTALEKHNPGVEFDWTQIMGTPIPSADAERWRERRRQERAARRFAAEDAAVEDVERERAAGFDDADPFTDRESTPEPAQNAEPGGVAPAEPSPDRSSRRLRRHRRRRRGRRAADAGEQGPPGQGGPVEATEADDELAVDVDTDSD
jgi:hypothetical protein